MSIEGGGAPTRRDGLIINETTISTILQCIKSHVHSLRLCSARRLRSKIALDDKKTDISLATRFAYGRFKCNRNITGTYI